MEWKQITKDELKSLIDTKTYTVIGDMFGISSNAVKKKAKRFDIYQPKHKYNGHNDHLKGVKKKPADHCWWCDGDLKKTSKKYCSRKCQTDYEYYDYINKWLLGLVKGTRCNDFRVSDYVRKYIFNKYNNKCLKCGWSKINPVTNKIPLQIDHIDGDSKNNKESNLRLLCPNCHSLTPTFGALNKGKGRKGRQRYFGGYDRNR